MMIENLERVEKNEKVYYKMKAGGRTFTAFDNSEAFQQLVNKEFKQNDEVTLDFTDTPGGIVNGKQITFHNLVKITKGVKSGGPTPSSGVKSESGSVEKVDWEGKEKRMIRMNALRHAIGFFEINESRMKDAFPNVIPENAVINVARVFEKYIFEEEKKEVVANE